MLSGAWISLSRISSLIEKLRLPFVFNRKVKRRFSAVYYVLWFCKNKNMETPPSVSATSKKSGKIPIVITGKTFAVK